MVCAGLDCGLSSVGGLMISRLTVVVRVGQDNSISESSERAEP